MTYISTYSNFDEFLLELSETRTLIFDLDNTIYLETKFLFYVYNDIATYCYEKFGYSSQEIYAFLIETFSNEGRQRIFDKLKKKFLITDEDFISVCIEKLRNTIVTPLIEPFPYFMNFLKRTTQNPVFIITNGTPQQQGNKISSIRFDPNIRIVPIYSNLFSPKPMPNSFLYLKDQFDFRHPIYIGDCDSDFLFAKNCNIDYIEVFKPKIWNNKLV